MMMNIYGLDRSIDAFNLWIRSIHRSSSFMDRTDARSIYNDFISYNSIRITVWYHMYCIIWWYYTILWYHTYDNIWWYHDTLYQIWYDASWYHRMISCDYASHHIIHIITIWYLRIRARSKGVAKVACNLP